MSEFVVEVKRIIIEPHPNADKIELGKVDGYVSIVQKGIFRTGDLAAYIPEQAIVPEKILEDLGLVGMLDGSLKNRVKAKRFRGIFSQGLLYPARKGWKEGQDVAEELGIIKYEPVIPQQMRGRAVGAALEITINYDIENIKKYPHVIEEGEEVIMTEKIHGTFVQLVYVPQRLFKPFLHLGCYGVTSKGLGARGIVLDLDDEQSIHAKTIKKANLFAKIVCIKAEYKGIIGDNPIYIMGEIFGPGVQDLAYGNEVSFRVFDICYGERGQHQFVPYYPTFSGIGLKKIAKDYELNMVPVLYEGPFSYEKLKEITTGKETISGKQMHVREGVVVKPIWIDGSRPDYQSRVVFKSVSEDYLLRKGEVTEFN